MGFNLMLHVIVNEWFGGGLHILCSHQRMYNYVIDGSGKQKHMYLQTTYILVLHANIQQATLLDPAQWQSCFSHYSC
jgi:hypothetical protein